MGCYNYIYISGVSNSNIILNMLWYNSDHTINQSVLQLMMVNYTQPSLPKNWKSNNWTTSESIESWKQLLQNCWQDKTNFITRNFERSPFSYTINKESYAQLITISWHYDGKMERKTGMIYTQLIWTNIFHLIPTIQEHALKTPLPSEMNLYDCEKLQHQK